MKTVNNTINRKAPFNWAGTGVLTAFTASLCCITPVFALLSGVSGIAASFSWMEPIRPLLIGLTVLILGIAWYQKLKPRTAEEIQCGCEDEKSTFMQSKKFLAFVTVLTVLMLGFPSYSSQFYPDSNARNISSTINQDTSKTEQLIIKVKGMTCTGCESHLEHEVAKITGVQSVQASYTSGTAVIEFKPTMLEYHNIVSVINNTGYKVIEDSVSNKE